MIDKKQSRIEQDAALLAKWEPIFQLHEEMRLSWLAEGLEIDPAVAPYDTLHAAMRTIDAQAAEIEALTAQVEAMGIALGHQAVVIDALTKRDADQHAALKSIADITEKWLDAPDTADDADANFNCLCSIADLIYPLREGLGFPPVKPISPNSKEVQR